MSARRAHRRDLRLVPAAAAAWIGAAAAILHPEVAVPVSAGLWGVVVLALIAAWRAPGRMRRCCAFAAVALAAAAAATTHVAAAQPGRDRVAALPIDGGRAIRFDVVAVGKIEQTAVGHRFDALLERVRVGVDAGRDVAVGVGVPVLVRLADVPEGLDLGARVRMTGTAWRAEPGGRAVLIVDAGDDVRVLTPPVGIWDAASQLRRGLRAQTLALPPPAAGLISGLAVGDTAAVTSELDEQMKASSLSHLTAVSGANCALVVGLAFGAAAACRTRRSVRVGAGLAALGAFVVLVSPEPSVVRAAAMAAIAMLGVLRGRPGAGVSLLTTAVVVLLITDPWLALSLGFALSAAATAALLLGAGPLADGLGRWMPRPLALGLAVPLAAQLACGPLIVLISPRLSVYGVLANAIAAPAAPLGTILGLAACLGAGLPVIGPGLAALAWVPAAWIAATARMTAELPGSVVDWPEGLWGLVWLAVVGAAVAALLVPGPARVRGVAALLLAACAGVGVALGPVADVRLRGEIPSTWAMAACDVGQGDAIVLRSAERVALVDTGPEPEGLTRCLDLLGVGRIDLLVLTHFDLDHRGGLDAVRGRVGTVLHGPPDGADDARTIDDFEREGVRVVPAVRGMAGVLGGARWRVLWPRDGATAGNAASVVVEVVGGGLPATLLLGDLDASAQRQLGAGSGAGLLASYDVVKVAHHGSADQDAALYERIRPAVAMISVGENTYGHPRDETLRILRGAGARTARTDREGLVVVWREGGALRLWHERTPP
ncbi:MULTISPECIES: ComEC/Rec2 family competence protein [unclassified Microbacterium]|uniref:ComEC/Rec2 family competence protein n=1 Tax=unclassified Microbacterium TaxID=2609290 RepID=UPI0030169390